MRLRTLGGLELLDADFRRPKALMLLAYLAVEGPQDRRFLADLFWPRASNRLNSLAKVLSQLRREAPGATEIREGKVHLTVSSDIEELLERLRDHDAEGVRERYRAPFLEHVRDVRAGVEVEEWTFLTREFVAGRIRGLWLELALQEAAAGRVAAAAGRAEDACTVQGAPALEPHEIEQLYPILVVGNSHLTSRLRAEADEYGMSLPRSAEAAQAQLASWRGRAPLGSTLPTRTTTFIGRESEHAELVAMLHEETCRLITVVGPGGTGKTRLAVQVARQQAAAEAFAGGVYFVGLDALEDPGAVPSRIAEALDLDGRDQEEPLVLVKRFLAERQALLLLDNYEHLLEGAVVIDELLGTCPGVTCLVTSRERLHLEDEWLYGLTGLDYHPTGPDAAPHQASSYDATKLFLERARRVRREFSLDASNWQGVSEICALVEGYPLALELAAAWVRVMTPGEIAREIRRNVGILSSTTRNLPERQRSIQATAEHSWKLLTVGEQEVFRRLAAFTGGFTWEAAREVADAGVPVLTSLVDKAMLRQLANGRFDRHALLWQFAHEKLAADPVAQHDAEARHAAFFARWTEDTRSRLGDRQQRLWLSRFEEEQDNVRAALDWAIRNEDVDVALRLVAAVGPFWRRRGLFREGRAWLDRVLALPGVASLPVLHAQALTAAGDMARRLENYEAALARYQEGLAIYRRHDDRPGQGAALMVIGIIAAEQGDYATARRRFEESLIIHQRLGRRRGVATALNNLATMAELQGDYAAARSLNEESLSIKREIGDQGGVAFSYSNLGLIATYQGEYRAARSYLERCLDIERALEDRSSMVLTLNYLGAVAQRQGAFLTAAALYRQGLALAREIGDKGGCAESLQHLGGVTAELGDHPAARTMLQESLALGRELGNRLGVAASLGRLGLVALYRRKLTEARAQLEESLRLRRELGERAGIARSLEHLGRVAAEAADFGTARARHRESLKLRRQLGDRHETAASLAGLGLLDHDQNRFEAARTHLEESLVLWRDLGNRYGVMVVRMYLAGLETSLGNPLRAARCWGIAEALREANGFPVQPLDQARYDRHLATARELAAADRFRSAWREGHARGSEQAVADIGSATEVRLG